MSQPLRNSESTWMDIEEAAAHLKVSVAFIYKRTRKDAIPYHRLGGLLRFDPAELDEWLRSERAKTSVKAEPVSIFQQTREALRSLKTESNSRALRPRGSGV